MDKLQPVLAHKFWILFGLALLLPLVGWWLDTGALATQIEERRKKLDDMKPPQTATAANKEWIAALDKVNKVQDRRLKNAAKELWENQQRLMTWPSEIEDLMASVPYGGEPPSKMAAELYRNAYYNDLEQVLKIVEPYDQWTGTGKVRLASPGVVPHVPQGTWKNLPPQTKEMWNAQEDLWLVRSILGAIARTNEGSTSIGDAAVRELLMLQLRGGSRSAGGAGAGVDGGYGAEGGEYGEAGGYGGMEQMMEMMGGRTGEGGAGGLGQAAGVDFDPTEEFGPPDNVGGAASEGEGEYGASEADYGGEAGGYGGEMMPGMAGMMGGQLGGAGAANADRYIDEGDELPYKTRGFYLKVVMDHQKLPEFLAQLASMEWPTQIVRVHQVSRDAGASRGMGTGEGGYPGGGGGYPGMGGGDPGMAGGGFPGMGSGGFPGMGSGGFPGMGSGGFPGMGGGGMMPGLPGLGSGGAPGGMMPGYGGGYGYEGEDSDGGYGYGGMPLGMNNLLGGANNRRGNAARDPKALEAAKTAREQFNVAMSDPFLAEVVVAGLMTIYKPPADLLQSEEQPDADPAASPEEPMTPEEAAEGQAGAEGLLPSPEAAPSASESPEGAPSPLPGAAPQDGIVPPLEDGAAPADGAIPSVPGLPASPPGEAAPAGDAGAPEAADPEAEGPPGT